MAGWVIAGVLLTLSVQRCQGEEAGDSWRSLRPGSRCLVWYSDDRVWHERLCLYPEGEGFWVIATPDTNKYDEDLGCRDPKTGPQTLVILGNSGELPLGLGRDVYLFRKIPSDAELRRRVKAARQAALRRSSAEDVLRIPGYVLLPGGRRMPWEEIIAGQTGSQIANPEPTLPSAARLDAG